MKTNEDFMRFMPDYLDDDLPEREYFFWILSTLYPDEVAKMVKTAYKIRNKEHEKPEDELIEITGEFLERLKDVVAYKSKCCKKFIKFSNTWKSAPTVETKKQTGEQA